MIDEIFPEQLWSGNAALGEAGEGQSPLGKARLHYFELNNGPWSDLDEHAAFVPGVPPTKLPGANFYPEDMTSRNSRRGSEASEIAAGTRHGILFRDSARTGEETVHRPYNEAYRKAQLANAAMLLNEAAELTPNDSLKDFSVCARRRS